MLLKKLTSVSVYLLWIAAVLDPIGNFFYLRYIAMGFGFLCLILIAITNKIVAEAAYTLKRSFLLFLSLVMPLYGLLLYSFQGGADEFTDTSYIASGVLFLFSLLYYAKPICEVGIRALVLSLRMLSVITIFVLISQTTASGGQWINFFTERNVALVSFREYAGIRLPYIYFLASPMLIFLIAYEINNLGSKLGLSRILSLCFAITAFAVSGTRAHIILAIIYIPIYFLLLATKRTLVAFSIIALCMILSILTLDEARILLADFFSPTETSNLMKISFLYGYLEIFNNPVTFIFGEGFNAHEWSSLLREMIAIEEKASKTELTYIELIRVYGVCIGGAFLFLLVMVVRASAKLPNQYRWLYPALVLYLLNSSFNPYLFSTNGILPLSLVLSLIVYTQKRSSKHPLLVRTHWRNSIALLAGKLP